MGKRSFISRIIRLIMKKNRGPRASRGALSQEQAPGVRSSAEKLLLEMKFGKR
ncbi:MAG: hypothetical protein WHX93_11850 [bacterium]